MRVATGYAPRPLQQEIHRALRRFNVLVCHRRFGKTVLCVNELIDRALQNPRPRPRYAYVAPLYRQAKQTAWDYLKHYTRPIPGVRVHETELRVDLPGERRIQLFGADSPDALRGLYLDGVVLDEYAEMSPRLFSEVLRPALADREGWAIFIGTPRGRNAFWRLYEDACDRAGWFRALYRASETGILPAAELAAARRDMSAEEYAQEFDCAFEAAVPGAYYGAALAEAERDGRVARVPWEPAAPVHTGWDLGIGDSTAIWFLQQVGREIRWIDYYEMSGMGLDHYARVLADRPYVYGEHLLPHDAQARELGTGRTRIETLNRLGLRPRVVPRHAVADGINAVRNLLPQSWFDAEKCRRGLEVLRNYRRDWDPKLGVFRPRPLHDWASHGADAARTAAMGLRPQGVDPGRLPRAADSAYRVLGW